MIDDDQLTALAREFAEEMIKGKPSEELPNCLKNSMLAMNTEYIAEIFQWLTRRFYIVEKSKVKETWKEITDVYLAHRHITYDGARYLFNEVLFPEIAKEVEG